MSGDFDQSSAEFPGGVDSIRERDGCPTPAAQEHAPRFTRGYAEVVRDLLAGRYTVGEAIEWESTLPQSEDGHEPPIVGAGGPGLLLEGTEVQSGDPVSILILDPLLWPDDEAFHVARLAANRMSTLSDPTLILPRRVLWEVSARCLVLILNPVPAPPHRGPDEMILSEPEIRRAGAALCRASRTLARLRQSGVTCQEVWFTTTGQVRILRVPGIPREEEYGVAQGVAAVVQRLLDRAGITPGKRLGRALSRAAATPRFHDADALEALHSVLAARHGARIGAAAALLGVAAGLVWLGTAFTWVDAGDRVLVVNAWGAQRELAHGLHLKWPAPIESTRRIDAAATPIADESADLTPSSDAPEAPSLAALDETAAEPFAPPEAARLAEEPPLAALDSRGDPPTPTDAAAEPAAAAAATPAAIPSTAASTAEPAPAEPTFPSPTEVASAPAAPAAAPYPAAELARYYARGSVEQARSVIDELADRLDALSSRRTEAAQRGDESARLAAAEAMRIFSIRGVDSGWLNAARIRLNAAEAALADGNAPVALEAVGDLLEQAIERLESTHGADTAASALLHAQRAEQSWLAAPEEIHDVYRDRAAAALASIDSGRSAIADGDLAAAADQLTSGAEALEALAAESSVAAVRRQEQQAAAILQEWETAWSDLARAGFPAPEDIALAYRHYERGLESLQREYPADAADAFESAIALAQRRLERLADERLRASQIDHRARTPLHHAAVAGDVQRARYALVLGAPLHARDLEGNSALRLAVLEGNLGVARVLLEHGADANDRADSGRPLVFDAIGNPAAFLLLLEHGARAGWTVRGSTLLHEVAWARARHGVGDTDQVKMATALLDRGIDPAAADASGETPLQIAERTRAAALAEFLRKRTESGRELQQPGTPEPARPD